MSQKVTRTYLESRLGADAIADITGNAPPEIKELPVKWLTIFRSRGNSFSNAIAQRLKVTEVSIVPSPDDPLKLEGKVVCEIVVTEDMCNGRDVLHDGCILFLIDECSAVSLVVINAAEGRNTPPGVSNTINTLFHTPATVGTKLRIVNTSLASGYDLNSARSEVFDAIHHRLIASGTQLTTPPSRPPNWKT